MQALCGSGEGMYPAYTTLPSPGSFLKTSLVTGHFATLCAFFVSCVKKETRNRSTWVLGFRLGLLASQSKYGKIQEK